MILIWVEKGAHAHNMYEPTARYFRIMNHGVDIVESLPFHDCAPPHFGAHAGLMCGISRMNLCMQTSIRASVFRAIFLCAKRLRGLVHVRVELMHHGVANHAIVMPRTIGSKVAGPGSIQTREIINLIAK